MNIDYRIFQRGEVTLPAAKDARRSNTVAILEFPLRSGPFKASLLLAPKGRFLCALSIGAYVGYRVWHKERPRAWEACGEEASDLAARIGLISPRDTKFFTGGDSETDSFELLPESLDIRPYISRQLSEFGQLAFSPIYGSADNLSGNAIARKLATHLLSRSNMEEREFMGLMEDIHPEPGRVGYLRTVLSGFEGYLSGCLKARVAADSRPEVVACVVQRVRLLEQLCWPQSERGLSLNRGFLAIDAKKPGFECYSLPVEIQSGERLSVLDALDSAIKAIRERYPVVMTSPADCG